ncbi:MAG: 50S ribosomal protein L24 [Abditibacteriota bacterium]|nr:50S ribosomal protein L24 [Abditibacteriota bacterium]
MKKFKPAFEGKLRLKKGDEVVVLSGKDKGKKGKIIAVFPSEGKVRVDGINMVKKHQKSRGATTTRGMINQQTGIIDFPAALDASKVMLVCPKCGKFTRIAHDNTAEGIVRKCRKCNAVID